MAQSLSFASVHKKHTKTLKKGKDITHTRAFLLCVFVLGEGLTNFIIDMRKVINGYIYIYTSGATDHH